MPRGCSRPDLKATGFDGYRDLNEPIVEEVFLTDPPTGNLELSLNRPTTIQFSSCFWNARRICGQTTTGRQPSGPISSKEVKGLFAKTSSNQAQHCKEYEDHWKTRISECL
jgi:hypothetical protein